MSSGQRHAAAALVLASIFAAGPVLAHEPAELVRDLYTEPSLTFDEGRTAGYFSSDVDGAMKPGARIAPIGFDYRYGAGELQVSELQLVTDIDHDQARVVAVFKNRGKANSVDWTLCRRPDGDWRIADASSNTGAQDWDLRQILRLPAQTIRC